MTQAAHQVPAQFAKRTRVRKDKWVVTVHVNNGGPEVERFSNWTDLTNAVAKTLTEPNVNHVEIHTL